MFLVFYLDIDVQAVFRVDETTKEILRSWPLSTVRRWAGTADSFVLDFGSFDAEYLNVLTTHGQEMSQLMAEYIDIILNQKKKDDKRALASPRRNVWTFHVRFFSCHCFVSINFVFISCKINILL